MADFHFLKKTFKTDFDGFLFSQTIAVLAAAVSPEIRSSLMLSMVAQLVEDKDEEVAAAAVNSLALLVNLLEDGDRDKLDQVVGILLALLRLKLKILLNRFEDFQKLISPRSGQTRPGSG